MLLLLPWDNYTKHLRQILLIYYFLMDSHHHAMNSGQFDDHSLNKSANLLDQKLVSRVQKGDRTAFDLLLVKYQNRVASIVSRFVDKQTDIEDLTQDIFIRAYRAIHSFRGDSAFYTWLFRIAINQAKSYLKKTALFKKSKIMFYESYIFI